VGGIWQTSRRRPICISSLLFNSGCILPPPERWHMCHPVPIPHLYPYLYLYLGYLLMCQTACVSYLGCVSFNFPLASGCSFVGIYAQFTWLAIMRRSKNKNNIFSSQFRSPSSQKKNIKTQSFPCLGDGNASL